jgi:hypothetical protein
MVNTRRLEELQGESASASWDKWQQRAGAGIAIARRLGHPSHADGTKRNGMTQRRQARQHNMGAEDGGTHRTGAPNERRPKRS